ncbi:MAG TPA: DUF3106 domain-containing protein [Gammaproteobacteria bacterium]|nr:DUF3106 domain-containing protein [Gammaproteobacteria bacterium]
MTGWKRPRPAAARLRRGGTGIRPCAAIRGPKGIFHADSRVMCNTGGRAMKRLLLALCLFLATLGRAYAAPAQIPWDQLSPEEQRLLEPLHDTWMELPAARQQRLRKGVERWDDMSPEQKKRVRKRIRRWLSLSPEQRASLRKRLERFHELPPEQQQRLRQRYRWFRRLPPEKRRALREKWNSLSAEERKAFRERALRRWKHGAPGQRRDAGEPPP